MKISQIDIPIELLKNNFVLSLFNQMKRGRKLSDKQIVAYNKVLEKHKEKENAKEKFKNVILIEIYDYIIPEHLRNNKFIKDLHFQYLQNQSLSEKQIIALRNMLNIDDDFYVEELEYPEDLEVNFKNEFNLLIEKFKRNRFKKAKNKNKCISAIKSILDLKPDYNLIDEILNPEYWS